uniref:Uncharacterized protein n=1 Tax=Eutreptiella gymnastica TaxID=73025 RepID=A0A7S4FYE2_9EUGL
MHRQDFISGRSRRTPATVSCFYFRHSEPPFGTARMALPTAIGCLETAVGYPPTAIDSPPTTVGHPPTPAGYPPTGGVTLPQPGGRLQFVFLLLWTACFISALLTPA